MPSIHGRRIPLSLPRRCIADVMAVSRGIPMITVERRAKLASVVSAKRSSPGSPSWVVLFIKAFAIVSQRRPELRRSFMTFPFPHLFEASENFTSVAVAREYLGEPAVFFGHLRTPERKSLREIAAEMAELKKAPVESVRPFARMLKYARYPTPIRRIMWRLAMHLSGRHRVKTFGTFGITALGDCGARALNLCAPTAFNLSFGPISDGSAEILLYFDHRVIDGQTAVRTLADVETVLNDEIAAELREAVSLAA